MSKCFSVNFCDLPTYSSQDGIQFDRVVFLSSLWEAAEIFPGGGKVDVFRLLATQCKWAFTKPSLFHKENCSMWRYPEEQMPVLPVPADAHHNETGGLRVGARGKAENEGLWWNHTQPTKGVRKGGGWS